MARIFTLTVPFEGKDRTALVNLNSQDYDHSFIVQYLDQELCGILPNDNLVFSLAEGLKQPAQLMNEMAVRLVDSTVDALSTFFHKHQL